jgi:hypothetical protein
MILSTEGKELATDVMPVLTASVPTSVDPLLLELFIFSPFGLCCRRCKNNFTIQLDKRCISRHLKKHGLDSRAATVFSLLNTFKTQLQTAKAAGTIDPYRMDQNCYMGYSCICGQVFPIRKDNALRHCTRSGCDKTKIRSIELIKLCCGRYVSEAEVTSFFNEAPRITQQFDYHEARATLLPFLPKMEKEDHTYTHMYTPLIAQ